MPDLAEMQRLQLLFNDLDRRLRSEVERPRLSTDEFIALMRTRDEVKGELEHERRAADEAVTVGLTPTRKV